jgi:hypothetical protein
MCTGIEIGLLAASAGGAVMGGMGELQKGKAAQQQANYEAAIAEANAKSVRMKGASDAERIVLHGERVAGAQRAAAAASGVTPGVGSAGAIEHETARNSFLDQMTTIWNADTQGDSLEAQAHATRMAGKNARKGSKLAAGATFLTGLGSMGSQARTFGRTTPLGIN